MHTNANLNRVGIFIYWDGICRFHLQSLIFGTPQNAIITVLHPAHAVAMLTPWETSGRTVHVCFIEGDLIETLERCVMIGLVRHRINHFVLPFEDDRSRNLAATLTRMRYTVQFISQNQVGVA